jgi:hypothetical protein
MKKFNAGDLSKRPKEVFAAARGEGAIIQHKDRQGKVVEEFVVVSKNESAVWDLYQASEKGDL